MYNFNIVDMGIKPGPKRIAVSTGKPDRRQKDNKKTPGNTPSLKAHNHKKGTRCKSSRLTKFYHRQNALHAKGFTRRTTEIVTTQLETRYSIQLRKVVTLQKVTTFLSWKLTKRGN